MASPSRLTNIIGGLKARWHRAGHEIRRRLTWSRLYRVTSYARSALWIVPFLSILAVLISVPILRVLDALAPVGHGEPWRRGLPSRCTRRSSR